MNVDFDSFPWHDAELKELLVDRREAGERDEVHLRVEWPQGGEATFVFHDCYAMIANMNFGIIPFDELSVHPDKFSFRQRHRFSYKY